MLHCQQAAVLYSEWAAVLHCQWAAMQDSQQAAVLNYNPAGNWAKGILILENISFL